MKTIECTFDLHCDNVECGKNTELPEGKTLKDCIGMPCPHCRSNLLTQADYDFTEKLRACIVDLNEILAAPKEGDKMVEITIHHHDGKTSTQVTTVE